MAQLLVRDLKDETVAALKKRAKEHGRSAEAEHRAILEEALKQSANSFREDAAKFREELRASGVRVRNSADIIREERDKR
jgi:plasmid stability protein